MAHELGIGVMPWSPLKNGYLTGKHTRGEAPARGGIVPGPTDTEWQIIDLLERVAADAHTTMAAAALAWVRTRPGVTSTLIGARSAAQLQANLDSLTVELSAAQLQELNEASTPTLNFPALNNARFGSMLAFVGMTIDGIAIPSITISAEPGTR
jgi:aryl-alcohol dehydrogenase-like predicted oxidoreductase